MRIRDVGKLVCVLVLTGASASVVSCGDAGDSSSLFNPGGNDDGSNGNDGNSLTGDDGSTSDGPSFGDGSGNCQAKQCTDLGYTCGKNGDGCGGLIDCGNCTAPQYCGGGGYSKCGGSGQLGPDGAPQCTPQTCAQLGFNCGPAGDGCGGLIASCGTCSGNDICGGGGQPGVCGNNVPCTNLCQQQSNCDGGPLTTITGRVIAGTLAQYGTPDPVPNVLVYVPNSQVQPFPSGVQCGCPAASGDPLVSTNTAVDGTFTLTNMPIGQNIPLVIQLGTWRRQITLANVPACVSTKVGDIHMPRNKGEGDIPLTAISTGSVDPIECVLLKMGVDSAEFTAPSGTGRIQIYQGNGAAANGSPGEATLTGTLATMKKYDQILFPCWGQEVLKSAGAQANLISYGDAGGRIFATHYSYTWLFQNNPYSTTATWTVNAQFFAQLTGEIDTSFQKGKTFAQWMQLVGALTNNNPPQFDISNPRNDFSGVNAPALRWVYAPQQNNIPLHYTFETPINGNPVCGRVIYSDFHVTNSNSSGTILSTCPAGSMTSQEKALEYMLWDLASCVGTQKPKCTPLTCKQQGINCGPAGDGCGGLLQCGNCTNNQTCGGGGQPGQCGYPDGGQCTPQTCAQLGFNCGPAGDGCGGLLDCGTCTPPQTCGGGGKAGQCGGGSQ